MCILGSDGGAAGPGANMPGGAKSSGKGPTIEEVD